VNKKLKIAAGAGLIATVVMATIAVAQLSGEPAAQITGDFRNAAVAEVHDAQGQVLLRGDFAVVDGDDAGEVERHAKLTSSAQHIKATGEAEVEYQTDDPTEQEVELTVTGLTAGTAITFMIDGKRVSTATADKRGGVDIELAVKSTP
jgi:hypothetical protein